MQVLVNCGNGLSGKETLERWASDFLTECLARFRNEITRVEVQLNDEARGKRGGDDMHCMLEARLNSHSPIAVNHNAENMDDAMRGATKKLIHSLEHTLGRLERHETRSRDTIRKDPDAVEQLSGGTPG